MTPDDLAEQFAAMPSTGSLLIVSGPPGAGKSTVARLLADRVEQSALVAGDAFFGFLAAGAIEPWLPASSTQNRVVFDAAAGATAAYVVGGYTTFYDGVLGPWSIDGFLTAAGIAEADYVVLLPAVDRCLERITTRDGHEFDDADATRKMHVEFSGSGLDPRHIVANDLDDPAHTATTVRALADEGWLRYRPPS